MLLQTLLLNFYDDILLDSVTKRFGSEFHIVATEIGRTRSTIVL